MRRYITHLKEGVLRRIPINSVFRHWEEWCRETVNHNQHNKQDIVVLIMIDNKKPALGGFSLQFRLS
ncbi:hypothetical protein METHB2_1240003 [Candidatus Methylobacter favarea]|uniref:Uncharacterized protein n=1 Tax=Candidatus Methylobacter favarea TaxID=2707345 RepID=A0A8S0XEH2_9GAMM|nr:hypothetical protein METHB2_1240003 [Candidatus Methylobacter favarea]